MAFPLGLCLCLFDDVGTLISEHEIHDIPVAGTFLLPLLALATAWLSLIAANLTLPTVGASFAGFPTVNHVARSEEVDTDLEISGGTDDNDTAFTSSLPVLALYSSGEALGLCRIRLWSPSGWDLRLTNYTTAVCPP
jgi:hypothetical protein